MKILKFGLRLWITIASIFSFLVGWILLSHSPKPVQPGTLPEGIVTPLPTLEPLSTDDGQSFQNQQQLFFNNQPQPAFRSRPFFSTGGS